MTIAVDVDEADDRAWVRAIVDTLDMPASEVHFVVASAARLPALVDQLPPTTRAIQLGDPAHPHPRASHAISRAWRDEHVRELLAAFAAGGPLPQPPLAPPRTPPEAHQAKRALAAAQQLAGAADLLACETALGAILVELLAADRASCVYHDADDGALWSEARLAGPAGDERRAVAGLVGYAARTGAAVCVAHAADDPRYAAAIDDPDAGHHDRVLAQPVLGAGGAVHAVLVCARRERRAEFSPDDAERLARFAALVGPALDQVSIHLQAQAVLDEAAGDGLFRREALAAQAHARWGDVVRVSPRWLPWSYRALVLLLAASAAFVSLGTVATYSSGSAVVRSTARMSVTARSAGRVAAVAVAPGAVVAAGTVLAQLDNTDQRAAVARLQRELETQLRNHMLDPADAAADRALRDVRNQLAAARAAVEERNLRSPSGGTVDDVRVRPGQHVQPGDTLAVVVDGTHGLEVIAMLPGEDRPQLAPGMAIRLELAGYRYAYQTVSIESVSPDVIAPTEARRVLGPDVGDGLALRGPVVIVRGRLPATEFVVDGRILRYHDGMIAVAEVRVREEPILFALIPSLRRLR